MIPKLYTSLAHWWPLLSARSEYQEAAEIYRKYLESKGERRTPLTVLELGCGGGCNASYIKQWFTMTLTDLSSDMLAQSRELNPECEHIQGDIRDVGFQARVVPVCHSQVERPLDLFVGVKPGN